jgi:hypothetical protein
MRGYLRELKISDAGFGGSGTDLYRGLLCKYCLVDYNWNLVETDNKFERARYKYPTRRRY